MNSPLKLGQFHTFLPLPVAYTAIENDEKRKEQAQSKKALLQSVIRKLISLPELPEHSLPKIEEITHNYTIKLPLVASTETIDPFHLYAHNKRRKQIYFAKFTKLMNHSSTNPMIKDITCILALLYLFLATCHSNNTYSYYKQHNPTVESIAISHSKLRDLFKRLHLIYIYRSVVNDILVVPQNILNSHFQQIDKETKELNRSLWRKFPELWSLNQEPRVVSKVIHDALHEFANEQRLDVGSLLNNTRD